MITPKWTVVEAEARFDELLETCLCNGPQVVTQSGIEKAVLVPIREWKWSQAGARRTLKELLLADSPRTELMVRLRAARRRRATLDID